MQWLCVGCGCKIDEEITFPFYIMHLKKQKKRKGMQSPIHKRKGMQSPIHMEHTWIAAE